MHIILDCDEVICSYLEAFVDYAISRGYQPKPEWKGGNIDYFVSNVFDFKDGELMDVIRDFSLDEKFSQIPFIPGVSDSIKRLKDDGARISIVTSAGNNKRTYDLRAKNLESLPIDDLYVLPLDISKHEALSRLEKGVFVDDLMKNVVDGNRAGHLSFLNRRPHNADVDHHNIISHPTEISELGRYFGVNLTF